jgi:hypothetical protein
VYAQYFLSLGFNKLDLIPSKFRSLSSGCKDCLHEFEIKCFDFEVDSILLLLAPHSGYLPSILFIQNFRSHHRLHSPFVYSFIVDCWHSFLLKQNSDCFAQITSSQLLLLHRNYFTFDSFQ